MTKIVVAPSQVAHLWANKSQDMARNSGGSMSFSGPAIYSYGQHYVIALHLDDDARSIVWNDYSYSSTTQRHRSHVVHAMSHAQCQRRVSVPNMSDNEARDLQYKRNNPDGKTIPQLAADCVKRVLSEIETIGKASARATRVMSDAWSDAKRYEASGKFLCAYVAKGKKAPKWPVPDLPAELPVDKDERAALVRSLVKGELLTQYKALVNVIFERMETVRGWLDLADDAYQLNMIASHADATWHSVESAERMYVLAMGKKPSALVRIRKELTAVCELAKAKKARFDHAHALYCLRTLEQDAYKIMRRMKQGKATLPTNRRHSDAGYIASKMRDAVSALTVEEMAPWKALHGRLTRIATFETANRNLARAHECMETGDTYGEKFPGDARRQYSEAFKAAKLAQNSDALYAWKSIQIDSLLLRSHGMAEQMHAAIAAKHAADIEAWKAGEKQSLPYDAGTYARIQGNEVVTSRGARVPIEHACRLARIARRVIAAGGKAWQEGAGPRVGGFTVQSIGANGSAVIGCHEFDGAEGLRLLEVLESCADCQHAEKQNEIEHSV